MAGKIKLDTGVAPAAPAVGLVEIYAKTDKKLYLKDDTGLETDLTGDTPVDTDELPEGATNLYFTNERAQDAVGTILTDTASIAFTYSDVGDTISAAIVPLSITNSHVSASAAISFSKLASLTANRVLLSDGSGVVDVSTTTNTELGYLSGVTSPIQTQISGKQDSDTDLTALAGLSSTGIITRTGSGTAAVRTIQAGTGISVSNGSGVSADPTVALADTAVTPTSYGTASQVGQFTVDAQGRLTLATNVTIAVPLSAITDVSIAAANLNSLDDGVDSPLHFHASDRARANHTGTQLLATVSDVTISVTDLNTLDDGVNTALHFHDTDRARANHTGTQLAATISDFNTVADARVALKIEDALVDGVTTKAPSQNVVYDALYQSPDKVAANIIAVTGTSYTVLTPDKLLLVSQVAATTITLPNPTALRSITIKDTAGTRQTAAITVARFGSESIDGLAASRVLQSNYGSWTFTSNGSNWFIE